MSEYLNLCVLLEIQKSVGELLANESNSQEIQQSSVSLSKLMVPCFYELRRSASRMKDLLQVCLTQLDHAEDVWNSKPRIIEIASFTIWEQIGELSGLNERLHQLTEQYASAVLQEFNHSLEDELCELKLSSFVWSDTESKFKKDSLGLFEKEKLIKSLRIKVDAFSEKLASEIRHRMNLLKLEIYSIQANFLSECINSFSKREGVKLHKELQEKAIEIEQNLKDAKSFMPEVYTDSFDATISSPLAKTISKSTFVVSLSDFEEFERATPQVVENLVLSIFKDRRDLISGAIARIISFYNDLLEKQARYRQETPEQRQAEKAWIDRQREQLQKVQANIEQVLGSAG